MARRPGRRARPRRLGIAVVVAPILADAGGTTAELVLNAAYPIGDVLLVALVIAFLCLGGGAAASHGCCSAWASRMFAAADSAYLYR